MYIHRYKSVPLANRGVMAYAVLAGRSKFQHGLHLALFAHHVDHVFKKYFTPILVVVFE